MVFRREPHGPSPRPTGLAQCSGPVDPVDDGVRKRVLAAIERIVNAEASGALRKLEITTLDPVGCSAEARVSLSLVIISFSRRHLSSVKTRLCPEPPDKRDVA